MGKYITKTGDTWDAMAFYLYGDEEYMQELLAANAEKVNTVVFDAGEEIDAPDLTETDEALKPKWRT